MSNTAEPRIVEPNSWRRWWRVGAKLGWRVWLTILPLSLIVGVGASWLSLQMWGLGFFVLMALSGLWQAALLHTAERAASGKRVDVSTPVEGWLSMWRLPQKQAIEQIKARGVISVVAALVMTVLVLVPVYLFMAFGETGVTAKTPSAPEDATALKLFLQCAANWVVIFLWSWLLQRGGSVSMANMLVRKYQLSWEEAHALVERAVSRNRSNFMALAMSFVVITVLMFLAPWLVFLAEVMWACVITVAARDIFEQKEALDPQEARVSATSLATAR